MKNLKYGVAIIYLVMAFAATGILFSHNAVIAKAGNTDDSFVIPDKVTGLHQIEGKQKYGFIGDGQQHVGEMDEISFSFDYVTSADGYDIELSSDNKTWTKVGTVTSKKIRAKNNLRGYYDIEKLDAGTIYYVRVSAYIKVSGIGHVNGSWSIATKMVTSPEQAVTGVRQTKALEDSITLTWDAVPGAAGYNIEFKITFGEDDDWVNYQTDKTTITISRYFSEDWKSYVRITPFTKTNSFLAYGKTSYIRDISYLPQKLETSQMFTRYTANSKKIELNWSEKGNAAGYQYQLYDAKTGKKLADKTIKSNSVRLTTQRNRYYKVRVRPYIKMDGKIKYSQWSGYYYYTYYPQNISLKLSNYSSGIEVSWPKVSGATNYTVYVSSNRYTGYEAAGTTKGTSLFVDGYNKRYFWNNYKYYFYVVANKKVGKITYHGGSTKGSVSLRYKDLE